MHTTLSPPQPPTPSTAPPTLPSILRAALFRFAFVYWLLIVIILCANEDVGLTWIGTLIRWAWNPIVVWTGNHVLGIPYELDPAINGSGDKTSDWVGVFVAATVAALATVVWSLVDRRATRDPALRSLLRVVLRYTLAFALLGYGLSKLCLLQFPAPGPSRLLQPYGSSSPMGLLWTFMGASPSYEIFAGAAEVLGALLLLFRRTTTLGALLLATVLVNVVMLNFCFDVPVKINSAHYLGMCIFLIGPDLGRLAHVLLFNRATQPAPADPVSPSRSRRVARRVVKYGVIAFILIQEVRSDLRFLAMRAARTSYDGLWNVVTFRRDDHDVPAIVTDSTRWQRIRFQSADGKLYVRWHFMDRSYGDLYTAVIDEPRQTMTLTPDLDPAKPATSPVTFRYLRTDPDHVTLEGQLGAATLSVQLARFDPRDMLLVNRGFHWINEVPFNR